MIAAATSASAIAVARVSEGCALSICEPYSRFEIAAVRALRRRSARSNDAPRRPPDLVSGGAPRCPTRRTSRRRIRWSAARRRAPAFGRNIRTGAPSLWSARRAPRLRTSTSRSAWETGEKGGAGGRRWEGAAPRLLDTGRAAGPLTCSHLVNSTCFGRKLIVSACPGSSCRWTSPSASSAT